MSTHLLFANAVRAEVFYASGPLAGGAELHMGLRGWCSFCSASPFSWNLGQLEYQPEPDYFAESLGELNDFKI